MGGAVVLSAAFAALVILSSTVIQISYGGLNSPRSDGPGGDRDNSKLSSSSAEQVNYSRVIASISVGSYPGQISIDTATGLLYVPNIDSGNVSVVDTNSDTVIASITTADYPGGAALDESSGLLYVSEDSFLTAPNTTVGINVVTNQVVHTTAVGPTPKWVTWDPANGLVYVADVSGGTVDALNGSTGALENTIQVGNTPTSIAFDSANDLLYVADDGSNNVSVIDPSSESVLENISLRGHPYEVISNPADNVVYATLQGADQVDAIDATTQRLLTAYPLSGDEYFSPSPTGMAYDPSNGVLYVTEELTNQVVGLNLSTGQIVSTVTLQQYPYDIAYDAADGLLYVDTYYRGYPDINSVVVLGPVSAANNTTTRSSPGNSILGLSPTTADLALGLAIGLAAGSVGTFVVTRRIQARPPPGA